MRDQHPVLDLHGELVRRLEECCAEYPRGRALLEIRVFSFFDVRAVHEIRYGVFEDFSLALADRGLSPKSRRNALGAFRSFMGWLKKRGELHQLPEFPWPKVDEYEPRILSIEDQGGDPRGNSRA